MQKPTKIIDIFPPKSVSPLSPPEEKEELPQEGEILPAFPEEKKEEPKRKKIIILVSAILIIVFALFNFVLARAEIKIWPETKTLSFEEKVIVDAKINQSDILSKVIPGKIFEEERTASQQFSSSGKLVKEEYARGTIRVYNNYDSPQPLVATTRFQPPLEKVLYFRTTKTITVPAKGYLDVGVKADRPGQEYNIGPSTFSVPGLAGLPQYYSVYGKSFSSMAEGFKGETSQVTQEDLEKAKKTLFDNLEKDNNSYLRNKIPGDFILLEGAISQEIIDFSSPVQAGKEAESFNFTLKTRTKALSFKESDLGDFAKEIINLKSEDGDKKIQKESLKIDYYPESINKEQGRITLNLKISAKIYSEIDLENLKNSLLGKTLNEARWILEGQPKTTSSKIELWPFWIKKIPNNANRVKIELNID